MPIRSNWKLQREGFTADTLGSLIKHTLLNPALTVPLVLLARYTEQGRALSLEYAHLYKPLNYLLWGGLASWVSGGLDKAVINNFTSDKKGWDWKNKEVVVVTGGSDGIGAIVVQLLAETGTKIAVLDVQALTFSAPSNVHYIKCDLRSSTSITAAAEEIRTKLGNPTVLINNAGVARGKSILDSTENDVSLTFAVNTMSHYILARQFLPAMIKENHGMIVTVSSVAAYVTAPHMVDYASSKAASLTFHEGLAAELATLYNAPAVRTVAICQGYTRTKLFDGFDDGDKLVNYRLEPETVAETIVKAVLKGESDHILLPRTGWYITRTMKGWPIWMQYTLRKRLTKMMKNWRGRQVFATEETKI